MSSVTSAAREGHPLPKEVGDFGVCHVLILDRVVQQCGDDDVRTPVDGLCNQTGDFDQMVEVRLRFLALPLLLRMFARSEVGRSHDRDDVIHSKHLRFEL